MKSKHKGIVDRYFGGKGSAGTIQQIINCIRPAETLIEPFLGNGTLIRTILPARRMIGNDISSKVIEEWRKNEYTWLELYQQDAIALLQALPYSDLGKTVVYLDPPYPLSSRKSQVERYDHEMTDQQHYELLQVTKSLPCDVLISTYPNELYEQELKGWNKITFTSGTRKGVATENLYMNYQDVSILHDYRFVGNNYRERERIKRKAKRWAEGLQRLPPQELQAIFLELARLPEAQKCMAAVNPPKRNAISAGAPAPTRPAPVRPTRPAPNRPARPTAINGSTTCEISF